LIDELEIGVERQNDQALSFVLALQMLLFVFQTSCVFVQVARDLEHVVLSSDETKHIALLVVLLLLVNLNARVDTRLAVLGHGLAAVTHFHGKRPTFDTQDETLVELRRLVRVGCCSRLVFEEGTQPLAVDRCRCDDETQVATTPLDLLYKSEQKIRLDRTFVSLVDDDDVVSCEQRVVHDLTQEKTFGHDQQLCQPAGIHVFETYSIADLFAEKYVGLVGDPLRQLHCGDTTRLSHTD
jgi:hypothetical protein